jgi:RNA polymerase sigma-70 factor (ECF subfamily)
MTSQSPEESQVESISLEWNAPESNNAQAAGSPSPWPRERTRDREWAECLRAGDPRILSEVYNEFFPRVLAFVRRRLVNSADAEDLTQEIFIQLFRSIACFEGRSSLLTWTFGIAHNVCCRHLQNLSRRRAKLDLALTLSPHVIEPRMESALDAAASFEYALELLETRVRQADREIFRLRYAENLTLQAIAAKTGRSKDSVRNSLKRSRTILSDGIPGLAGTLEHARVA